MPIIYQIILLDTEWRAQVLNLISRLLRDNHGVTSIEYALVASLISVAAVALIGSIGTDLRGTFSKVAASF
jgi:pilus assembly protein Flp/PilA